MKRFVLTRGSVFLTAALAYLIGQYFRGYWLPHTTWPFACHLIRSGVSTYCDPIFIDILGYPLIVTGEFLAVVAVVLLFANEHAWMRWRKFSLYFIPIAFVLVLWIYPITTPMGGIAPYAVGVRNAGWLYLLATLYIVLREALRTFLEKRSRE
jgi:hypothetical protein